MDILNSSFVSALIVAGATIGTGWFAIRVFKLQKKDEKTNAAVSLLFEIRNAENKVDVISEKLHTGSTTDLPSVLPVNNWRKYSHLFVKDFDEDELRMVNSFYNSCEVIEDLSYRENNFLWIAAEEKAKSAQTALASIHMEFQRDIVTATTDDARRITQNRFNAEKEGITKFYGDETYFYVPKKIMDGLKFHVDSFQRILNTTVGAKLKKIAENS